MRLLAVFAAAAAAYADAQNATEIFLQRHNFTAAREFLRDVGRSSAKSVVVWDVGANNAAFSYELLDLLAWLGVRQVRLIMFEPQRALNTHAMAQRKMQQLKERWQMDAQITLIHKAAWLHVGNLTFHVSHFDMASSLIETQARAYRRNGVMKVETVDLAAELQAQLSPLVGREKAVLLKLDVEGAEYDLLSHLLMRGALCLLDYIIVEWHLNSLTPERRLAGLGLQLSLGDMLARGCPAGSRPREVTINAEVENNAGMPVPGLAEEADLRDPLKYKGVVKKWGLVHRRYGTGVEDAKRRADWQQRLASPGSSQSG